MRIRLCKIMFRSSKVWGRVLVIGIGFKRFGLKCKVIVLCYGNYVQVLVGLGSGVGRVRFW